jgi:nucleotide-binding universal stress UspA family protein
MLTKIVVPLDQSSLAEDALGCALALARATDAGIDLVLVHDPFGATGYDDMPSTSQRRADEEAYLDRIAHELQSGASIRATRAVERGVPAEMICRHATDVGADLIVMTSHGRTGFNRAWLGSVADGVIREAGIPVLLLRSTEASRPARRERLFAHVLVLIDTSAESEAIIDDALSVARAGDGHITLLHIVQPVPLVIPEYGTPITGAPGVADVELTERVAAEAREKLGALAVRVSQGVDVNTAVVTDTRIALAILDFAAQTAADLVALTTRGRGASRLIVGSIADKVLRGSNLPVLIKRTRPD